MKPYNDSGKTKKEEVQAMFDHIAPRYDLLNHILSMGIDRIWRRRTVREIRALAPRRILDIATGTGDLALALARRIGDSTVTGLDLSEQMLVAARRKVEEAGLGHRIDLIRGDAEHLPFDTASFDAATVAFGVRNFGDLDAGLGEIARVVRPGGGVAILEFSRPDPRLFRALYEWYGAHILPRIGGALSHDRRAYDYLPASVREFPAPAQFVERMQAAGFTRCRVRRQSLGIARIYIGLKEA